MKKVVSMVMCIAFCFLILIGNFSIVASAEQYEQTNEEISEIVITEEEAERLLQSSTAPLYVPCCGSTRWVWRQTKIVHVVSSASNVCIARLYFGDHVCLSCGTVLERDTCYRQLDGCGKTHNGGYTEV